MKEHLYRFYNIHAVGIIQLKKNVYKIKDENQFYVLKIVQDRNIEKVYEYIEAAHLTCFIQLYMNNEHQIVTPYFNQYFYLMPYIDNNQGTLKEMKIKFYFETLAYIHHNSYFYTKINEDYFQTLQGDILKIIHEREEYYQQMIQNYEKIIYRSPSQWLLVLNYYRIYEALCRAKEYLKQYLECVKDHSKIRVCLTYKHFHYNHISLKQRKLISIDNISIDLPIYDLFDIYQRIPDILFDLDCFSEYYLKKFELLKEEKLLLCCLMNVVPIIFYDDNEIENIIKLSRLLYYLDSIQDFIQEI